MCNFLSHWVTVKVIGSQSYWHLEHRGKHWHWVKNNRGVLTSVDATAFASKKSGFLGNYISCCECTTNNQTSLVFLCIMYSIYRSVFIYVYSYIRKRKICMIPVATHTPEMLLGAMLTYLLGLLQGMNQT